MEEIREVIGKALEESAQVIYKEERGSDHVTWLWVNTEQKIAIHDRLIPWGIRFCCPRASKWIVNTDPNWREEGRRQVWGMVKGIPRRKIFLPKSHRYLHINLEFFDGLNIHEPCIETTITASTNEPYGKDLLKPYFDPDTIAMGRSFILGDTPEPVFLEYMCERYSEIDQYVNPEELD